MNTALLDRPLVENPAIALGDTPDILAAILDPDVQLALWRRQRPASLDWLDALEWDKIDDIDSGIDGPDHRASICRLLCDTGYPQTSEGDALADEIARLACCFARLMGCERLRLRLEVVETDACRKFHMDYVTARLLMPLVGPGTQWIDIRDGMGAPLRQLEPGHVGIFKGRLAVKASAILHRSPPVAASGETRLLLALNPAPTSSNSPEHCHA